MTLLHEQNRAKVRELQSFAQEPCLQWIAECFAKELPFRIVEAFRSQSRQNMLFAQGRTVKGKIVTWTRSSIHTQRLAIDIDPVLPHHQQNVRWFLAEIAALGEKYNIVRPIETLRLGDFRHFQLDNARPYYAELSIDQQKKKAAEAIKKLSGNMKDRAIQRYVKQWEEQPHLD